MRTRTIAYALGLTLLAGCTSLPPLFNQAPAIMANGQAELRLQTQVRPGGPMTQALVNPYGPADVHHVTLTLFKLNGTTEIPLKDAQGQALAMSLTQAQLSRPVAFSKLWRHTTYRVKARAYADAEETRLISKGGAEGQIDIAVADDDRPAVATLSVTLIDRVFDGAATAPAIAFTPGTVTSSAARQIGLSGAFVTTLAGSPGEGGFTDTGGPASTARFSYPNSIDVDAAGNLYVLEEGNHAVRMITPEGRVSTLAGSGQSGTQDGIGRAASFQRPTDVAVTPSGALFVTESSRGVIRKLTPGEAGWTVTTFATGLAYPHGLAVDAAGTLYVAEILKDRIVTISPEGTVTPFAGTRGGLQDGDLAIAMFRGPFGVEVDAGGNVYVADSNNHCIRKISREGVVSTLAGSRTAGYRDGVGADAQFNLPFDLEVDAWGNVYVADGVNGAIRQITPQGKVTTLVGGVGRGYQDGPGAIAEFAYPTDLVVDASGRLYVPDSGNHVIRRVLP